MNKNILIVDDIEFSREIFKSIIQGLDHEVTIQTAINAYDAWNKIESNIFNLIIMDIMMPEGDGFELLRMISEKNIKTKIIIISSLDKAIVNSVSMLGKLYSLNIIYSLEKPIKSNEMSNIVDLALLPYKKDTSYIKDLNKSYLDDDYPICLMYQPQIMSNLNKILGFEVLSRWSNVDGSLLSPNSFLPVIDKLEKQKVFTQVVIRRFIKDYNCFFKNIDGLIKFSINIAPNLILDNDIIEDILNLHKVGVNHQIVIEITGEKLNETLNEKELLANLLRLRFSGVEISIDDFCIESSNIKYISKMPINEIKISKEITWSFSCYENMKDIVEKIKEYSTIKNIRTVFNGVENIEIKNKLEEMDCYYHQGFLYSVPILPKDCKEYTNQNSFISDVG